MNQSNILIIGDEEPNIMPLRGLLEDEGGRVFWVPTGADALVKATTAVERQEGFKLAILHSVRLDMDTPTLVRKLKQSSMRIVICTGADTRQPSFQRVYREAGADAILQKSYDVDELMAEIKRLLAPAAEPASTTEAVSEHAV